MEKKNILIVNNVTNREEKLNNCLSEEYNIIFVMEEDGVLEAVKKLNFEVALILVDMTKVSEELRQFFRVRKNSVALNSIPVLAITKFNDQDGELNAIEVGASDIICEPFDKRIINRRIRNLIKMSKANLLDRENEKLQNLFSGNIRRIGDFIEQGILFFELGDLPKHIYVNESLCKLLGYTKNEYEELVKRNPFALVHPDDLEELRDKIKLASEEKSTIRCRYRLKKLIGKYQWVILDASVIKNLDGKIIFCGVVSNADKIKSEYEIDELTGLCSSESLEEIVDMFFKGNSEEGKNNRMAALFMIDVDNFKSINDHFGHVYGDHVLIEIGQKIHSIFRDEDITAHIGGDEFCVFLRHQIPEEIIELRAKQICEAIRTEYRVAGNVVSSSCSVGVAIAPKHGNSYQQLFKNADKAQYTAKKSGKNKYVIFEQNN